MTWNPNTRFTWTVVTGAVLTLGLAACGGAGEATNTGGGTIDIGATLPLTGTQSAPADSVRKGYQLAVDAVNAEGGINGKKINLKIEDDKFDPVQAKQLTKQLIARDRVVAMLGTYGSATGITQSAEADRAGVPGVYPYSSAPSMVERGLKNVFNLYPLSADSERVMDEFLAAKVKPKSVAILYVDNPFATPGAEQSKARLEAAGVKVPVFEKFAITTTDFTTLIAKVKAADVDVVKELGYDANYVAYVQAVRRAKLDAKVVYAETLIPFEPSVHKIVGNSGEGIIGDAFWYPGSNPDFERRYEAKFGAAPDSKAAFGYSAAQTLFKAVESAGVADPGKIRAALTSTQVDSAIGTIKFNQVGQNVGQIRLAQWSKGEIKLIWPETIAEEQWQPWQR